MNRKRFKILAATAISLLAAIIFVHSGELRGAQRFDTLPAKVIAVNDGDTLSVMIGRKKERVRMIGIDAPELAQRPWGAEAKRYLKELVTLSRNSVTLEFDLERRDRYGRLLAYVWTPDNRMLNLEMLRNGLAVLYTVPPNVKHVERLREDQQYAKARGLGIWGKNGLRDIPRDYRKAHPR